MVTPLISSNYQPQRHEDSEEHRDYFMTLCVFVVRHGLVVTISRRISKNLHEICVISVPFCAVADKTLTSRQRRIDIVVRN
jgi:hypothetical protein